MGYDTSNIFAKILRGEIPCHQIFETPDTLAILDAFPCTEGHALLIPKYDVQYVEDLAEFGDDKALSNVMRDLGRLAKIIREGTGSEATNVLINNGPAAGQAVPHLHFHVVPRKKGDGLIKHPSPMEDRRSGEQKELLLGKLRELAGQ